MSQEYKFEFSGTKDDLILKINTLFNHSYGRYRYDNYIIDIVDEEIRFGVERGGHSGGYWYIPTITECGEKIELCGSISYIGPDDNRNKFQKVIDTVKLVLLLIVFSPIFLTIILYSLVEAMIRKIFKLKRPKNTEDKLNFLMETHLGCVRKYN